MLDHLRMRDSHRTQGFCSCPLGIAEVIGVVDDPAGIGILVIHP